MNKGAYLRTVFILFLLLCCSALAAVCIGRLSVNPDVYQVISSKLAKQPVID